MFGDRTLNPVSRVLGKLCLDVVHCLAQFVVDVLESGVESLDVDLLAALAAVVDRLHLLQRRLHDHSVRRVGLWVARSLVRVHRDGAVFGLILSSFVFEVT